MNIDPKFVKPLVDDGFCISLSQARRIVTGCEDEKALNEWREKQKLKKTFDKAEERFKNGEAIKHEEFWGQVDKEGKNEKGILGDAETRICRSGEC